MTDEALGPRFERLVASVLSRTPGVPGDMPDALRALAARLASQVASGLLSEGRARDLLTLVLSNLLKLSATSVYAFAADPASGADLLGRGGESPESAGSARQVKRGTKRAPPLPVRKPGSRPREPLGATRQDEPRTLFPVLTCPGVVVAEQTFELRLGISSRQDPDVFGEAFTLPPKVPRAFALTVQIVAPGFRAGPDESLRQVLMVTARRPHPVVTLQLTAEKQTAKVSARAIQAVYSVGAQTIGMAVRAVSVIKSKELLDQTPSPPAIENRDFAAPVGSTAPDMTVRLLRDRTRVGGLSWSIETRFADIDVPETPMTSDIGTDPDKFARKVMTVVNARQGKPALLESYLVGLAKTLATRHIPAGFWTILRQVVSRVGGPPTILLLSEEPYVPWELAFVDAPLIDPAAPAFLAAQAVVGRWPLGSAKLPPPEDVSVTAVGVVSGVYSRPGFPRLQAAEDEAATLVRERFGAGLATAIEAAAAPIIDCLSGNPEVDLLHFAVHGTYDATGIADGIVMTDGSFLDPFDVRSAKLTRRPFVFLNACQVGQGNSVLGVYAGMAEAFLAAGASAVIAPLWSIKDSLARDVAVAFYASDSIEPAQTMRRARTISPDVMTSELALRLAYQFFGHPSFKLHLPSKPTGGRE